MKIRWALLLRSSQSSGGGEGASREPQCIAPGEGCTRQVEPGQAAGPWGLGDAGAEGQGYF